MSEKVGDFIDSFISKMNDRREVKENEYLGENGLIYCSKCHTPLQCRINLNGKEAVVGCICKCREEELEREKKRQEEEE